MNGFHKQRGAAIPDGKHYHVKLSPQQFEKLAQLSRAAKLTGADVIRSLIESAIVPTEKSI